MKNYTLSMKNYFLEIIHEKSFKTDEIIEIVQC